MVATLRQRLADPVDSADERVLLWGVTWEGYEKILALRGDKSSPRICYLEGRVEIMSPSHPHEDWKKRIARLIELWAYEMRVPLRGFGSWTLKQRLKHRGVEPDECYVVGEHRSRFPDLAIEVVWTSGGIDKLEIYRGLGVREVWFWEDSALRILVLVKGQYVPRTKSTVLPTLDMDLLLRCLKKPDQLDAIEAMGAALRRKTRASR